MKNKNQSQKALDTPWNAKSTKKYKTFCSLLQRRVRSQTVLQECRAITQKQPCSGQNMLAKVNPLAMYLIKSVWWGTVISHVLAKICLLRYRTAISHVCILHVDYVPGVCIVHMCTCVYILNYNLFYFLSFNNITFFCEQIWWSCVRRARGLHERWRRGPEFVRQRL